jgi:hypothetical protein
MKGENHWGGTRKASWPRQKIKNKIKSESLEWNKEGFLAQAKNKK